MPTKRVGLIQIQYNTIQDSKIIRQFEKVALKINSTELAVIFNKTNNNNNNNDNDNNNNDSSNNVNNNINENTNDNNCNNEIIAALLVVTI